jgi:hypothetical protein
MKLFRNCPGTPDEAKPLKLNASFDACGRKMSPQERFLADFGGFRRTKHRLFNALGYLGSYAISAYPAFFGRKV